MAKEKPADSKGKMTEQLKEKMAEASNEPVVNVEVSAAEVSTEKVVEAIKEEVRSGGDDPAPAPVEENKEVISKPEAEMLARKFHGKKKEFTLPVEDTIKEVKERNKQLQEEKKKRKQQNKRTIRQLREYDPAGKKTCGRCAQRVPIETMDSNKQLCEVCAS